MLLKTEELISKALDYAVSICEKNSKLDVKLNFAGGWYSWPNTCYSANWALAGPIIAMEKISISCNDGEWSAYFSENLFNEDGSDCYRKGKTPLIAAMRCYVALKLGDFINIPDGIENC